MLPLFRVRYPKRARRGCPAEIRAQRRRRLPVVLLVLSLIAFTPGAQAILGYGDIVYDPSNFAQNVLEAERALRSNINEALQIANQVKQIEYDVLNVTRLPAYIWGEIAGDISALTEIVRNAEAISYAMQNLSAQFKSLYPGYVPLTNYEQQYRLWTTNTLESLRVTLEAAHLQNEMVARENAAMAGIQASSEAAVGNLEAIQANTQIAAQTVQQLQKLRELQMSQIQAQNDYMATEMQNQAAEKAALKAWLDSDKDYKSQM